MITVEYNSMARQLYIVFYWQKECQAAIAFYEKGYVSMVVQPLNNSAILQLQSVHVYFVHKGKGVYSSFAMVYIDNDNDILMLVKKHTIPA